MRGFIETPRTKSVLSRSRATGGLAVPARRIIA
jgi:hypothetical protein